MKTDIFKEALVAKAGGDRPSRKPSPIPCLGSRDYWGEFDCDYPHSGAFGCEDCVVNGGCFDPRTGKRFARRKKGKKP